MNKKIKTIKEIKSWLDFVKVKDYTINKDLTVDVDGDVHLYKKNLLEIPIQFGIIKGYFDCGYNNLTSLEYSPKECGNFYCGHNKLTSLKGSPKECKLFNCSYNKLKSLKGCPEKCDYFDCEYNPNLTSLKGCPKIVNGNFNCEYNSKLTKKYLNNFDFNFVKRFVFTDYNDINDNWNKKNKKINKGDKKMAKLKMDNYTVFSTTLNSKKIKNMKAGMNKLILKLLKPVPIKELKTDGGIIIPQQVLNKRDPRKLLKMGIVLKTNSISILTEDNIKFIDDIEIGDIVFINDLSGIHFDDEEGTYAIIKYEEILSYTKHANLCQTDKDEIEIMLKEEIENKK